MKDVIKCRLVYETYINFAAVVGDADAYEMLIP